MSDYWYTVVAMNDYQKQRFVERVIGAMFNTVAGKVGAHRWRGVVCVEGSLSLSMATWGRARGGGRVSHGQLWRTHVLHVLTATVAPVPLPHAQRIAVFGFAFKKDTGDTRETPAIDVCQGLLADGAKLAVWDPKVAPLQVRSCNEPFVVFAVEGAGRSREGAGA